MSEAALHRAVAGQFAPVEFIERFNRHWMPEPNSGCWLWLGDSNKSGYGVIRAPDKRKMLAHRASYFLYKSDPGKLHVLHKCDVTCCVNPDHLFAGTDSDNHRDKMMKGRAARKLTLEKATAIKRDTRAPSIVAPEYGVDECTVIDIRKGRTWPHA